MHGIGAHGKPHDLKLVIIPATIFKYFPANPATTPDQETEEPAPSEKKMD
jgi:hypothetical protein